MGAVTSTIEARMRCDSRKRRRRYCASMGKEWAAVAKQRRQRGRVAGSGQRRVATTTGRSRGGRRGKVAGGAATEEGSDHWLCLAGGR
ncbi:hypothetical protein B296_00006488 [Ensete ventricosum]|uniref:Uncharacterized protein n=1 Tax=Ensete ventricosum TaxID=4639 RepID=A0A427A6U0_ENSVE|nr:hypothetical protein B296_00006488 [Ensete ventricosum]